MKHQTQAKLKPEAERKAVSGSLVPRHAKLGGPEATQDRAAPSSPLKTWAEQGRKSDPFVFEKKDDTYANDNAGHALSLRVRFAAFVALIAMASAIVSMNASTIAFQGIIHTNDRVLSVAMDISPDALAYTMNTLSPGK